MTHILAKRGRVAATVNLLVSSWATTYYQQINYLVQPERCHRNEMMSMTPKSYLGPDLLGMPVMENSSLIFSSCHLELVILENWEIHYVPK